MRQGLREALAGGGKRRIPACAILPYERIERVEWG